MRNAGLDDSQAGIKIAGRNINNLRHADDTTLMAEREEEIKSLLMRVKEESERVNLRLNIKKTKITATSPITAWQIEGDKVEAETDFLFLGSKNTADSDCHHEIRRRLLLDRKSMVGGTQKKTHSDLGFWLLAYLGVLSQLSRWSLISPCSCGCPG